MRRASSLKALGVVAALALGLVLGACKSKPPPAKHKVKVEGMKFIPESLEVNAGDTIVWENTDIVPHTATAVDKTFDSGNIAQGTSWSLTAKEPGTHPYRCTFHPVMNGTVLVK